MSKQNIIAEMLMRPQGASRAELIEATGWKGMDIKLNAKRADLKLLEIPQADGSVRWRGVRPSVKIRERSEMPQQPVSVILAAQKAADNRRAWTKSETEYLKRSSINHISTHKIAAHLNRTKTSVRQKAFGMGLSLESRSRMVPSAKALGEVTKNNEQSAAEALGEIIKLNEQLAVIQVLHRQLLDNATDIGRRLTFCKHSIEAADGDFEEWAKSYLRWSPKKTESFMRRFDHAVKTKSSGGISADAALLQTFDCIGNA